MKSLISICFWTMGIIYMGWLGVTILLLSMIISPENFDHWLKKRLGFLFQLMCSPVKIEGLENIDPEKTYLFMANHVSLFDGPLLGSSIPVFIRGVEALRQFKWPFYGWIIKRLGNIPIDRKNIHASIHSIRRVQNVLRQGTSMVILPEGHRTLDGKMRPFKKLPFFLARESGVPIMPVGHSGLFTMKKKGSWHIRPTSLKVRFGEAISPETIRKLKVTDLMALTRSKIQQLIEYP